MPLHSICFDHNGQQIKAEVYYDFEKFSDAILISPVNTTEELDDIIFFRTGNKKWSTNSPFKEKFPLTIKNIIHCIDQQLILK